VAKSEFEKIHHLIFDDGIDTRIEFGFTSYGDISINTTHRKTPCVLLIREWDQLQEWVNKHRGLTP